MLWCPYTPLDEVMKCASLLFCLVCDNVLVFIDDDHHRFFDKRISVLTRDRRDNSLDEKMRALSVYRSMKIDMLQHLDYSMYVEPMEFHSVLLSYTASFIERPLVFQGQDRSKRQAIMSW